MQKHNSHVKRSVVHYLLSTALACGFVALFRLAVHVNVTTVALSLLVLVLIVATRWRLAHAVYLSIVCTFLYNFFFLPPVGTLTIADPQNWITLSVFLGTSVLVSHLSESERRQREISEQRRGEVERLYEFSQRLLLHEDLKGLARAAPSIAATVFGLRAVALYVREQDAAYYSDPENELLSVIALKQIAQNSESGIRKIKEAYVIPLMLGMQCGGALAIMNGAYSEEMYEAIGGLVAIALERAAALERTSHMEATREGERLRSALLDSITHELRTPLTAIRAAATSLIGQPTLPEAERNEMYAVVDEESLRLDRLIGEAVEMAQLDSAGLQVRPQLHHVRELIDTVLQEEHARLRGRVLEVHIPEGLPQVSMDQELVRRVLRHLIENAIKYSPAKTPLEIIAEVADERLLVHIADHGMGIEPSEQPFIFDKFFRGSNQRERVEGSGMGLAIAKAILTAHGGGIELKSEPGEGAIFTFWLPLSGAA
ncbi:MAG TPA: ATP-binding protein [Alloacidobacterium sp.]|jgi:two-component system sensor histidine kinase KdpD|nr:ATP-binding protein [Alloacidobacterium sp.]